MKARKAFDSGCELDLIDCPLLVGRLVAARNQRMDNQARQCLRSNPPRGPDIARSE